MSRLNRIMQNKNLPFQLVRIINASNQMDTANTLSEINQKFTPLWGFGFAPISIDEIRVKVQSKELSLEYFVNEANINNAIMENNSIFNFYNDNRQTVIDKLVEIFINKYNIEGYKLLRNYNLFIYWKGYYDPNHIQSIVSQCINETYHKSSECKNCPSNATGYVHVYGNNVLYAFTDDRKEINGIKCFSFVKEGHAQQKNGKTTHIFT